MRKWLRKICGLRRVRGQTTAEYAIIVALVAVASIAVLTIFGDQIRSLFRAEAKRIADDTPTTVEDMTTDIDDAVEGSINEFK